MSGEGCSVSSGVEEDLFPFPSPRKGQDSFLQEAREALSSGRHLLAHAPTGLGKTAVALTASLEVALQNGLLVFFLTSKQSQHRIAVETLRRISDIRGGIFAVDIISKQSLCPLSTSRHSSSFQDFCELRIATETCPYYRRSTKPLVDVVRRRILHVDEVARICRAFGRCPHKTAMDCLPEADIVICDYNYVFSPLRDIILERTKRAREDILVVVDEAHNLPSRIRDHLRGETGPKEILAAAKEAKQIDRNLSSVLVPLAKELETQFDDETREVGEDAILAPLRRAMKGRDSSVTSFLSNVRRCGEAAVARTAGTALLRLADFLDGWAEDGNPILRTRNGEEREFSYLFLDPSMMSREVFEKAHSSILMSGTLFPAETYSDLLGIPKSRCVLRTFISPFPRENRRVVLATKMTTLFKQRGDVTYQAYANLILTVSSLLRGNLAVFLPSYEFLESVRQRMMLTECGKEMVVETQGSTKEDKNSILGRLKEVRTNGGILLAVMGGSLSEGVDFRDNLLSAAVICGIPLTPPTVENEALRRFYSSRFGKSRGFDYSYLIPAMNKVVQSAGRCIRSESDRAVIILADKRFASGRYRRFLPKELFGGEEDVENAVREFFGAA
ncbi:MAG: ATP-dependent DNA helicase [Thermoplasmata archaeon]|nr:ATP-dependent DNA helicase [Thermoplasmata archaeon]